MRVRARACVPGDAYKEGSLTRELQHFKENPYFSNTVLKKEYKYVPPPVETDDQADADGITETMLEFSWERDVQPQVSRALAGRRVLRRVPFVASGEKERGLTDGRGRRPKLTGRTTRRT